MGGSHAKIGKTIRLIIESPVHLIGDGATTLRCRADVIVVDVIDLGPQASQRSPTRSPISRESDADELHRALVDAVAGRMHCDSHIAAAMFARLAGLQREPDPQAPLPNLSSRESEIPALVEQRRSNNEIMRQFAISAATVKHHMHGILQKLQVSRRGQAAARLRAHHAA